MPARLKCCHAIRNPLVRRLDMRLNEGGRISDTQLEDGDLIQVKLRGKANFVPVRKAYS